MSERSCIIARIDQALERMRAQGAAVRYIYLTEATHDQFDRAMCRLHGRKRKTAHYFDHAGHVIVRGSKDRIYSTHGVEFTIHKKLSPRVAEPLREAA